MVGTTVKDVNQHRFVKAVASFLKKSGKVTVPGWADIVKLGQAKELAPFDPDWYYVRTASIARRLYIRNPTGVGAFSKVYGGLKRNGTRPAHFCTASKAVIRKSLQTLETLKWAEKSDKGGRKLTLQGRKDLDRIASQARRVKKPAAPKQA